MKSQHFYNQVNQEDSYLVFCDRLNFYAIILEIIFHVVTLLHERRNIYTHARFVKPTK